MSKTISQTNDKTIVKANYKEQKYLRALYTGGTIADEAMKLLGNAGYKVYSNIPLVPEFKLSSVHESMKHTCIDLGEDEFTRGKPHPMIDPALRVERFIKESRKMKKWRSC